MDALRLEVKKDSWKQNQDGTYKLSLTLNPTDLDDNAQNLLVEFIKAPMGTRYMIGMAEIGDDEQPVAKRAPAAPAAPEKPRKPLHGYSYAEQAGIRCKNPKFQDFLFGMYAADWGSQDKTGLDRDIIAVFVVRRICQVGSRADLKTNTVAADIWVNLNAEFEAWAGLTAEAR